MNAQQAMKHYKQHRTFYMDAAGHRALYKLIKRQAKIIEQAKYATTEACVMCDNYCPPDRLPRRDGCHNCHVGRLIEMVQANPQPDKTNTT